MAGKKVTFGGGRQQGKAADLKQALKGVDRGLRRKIEEVEEAAYEEAVADAEGRDEGWDMFQTGKDW